MQDIEFTIENEKLYILQTRPGKRTPQASLKISIDMVNEKIIDEKTALMRINPKEIENLLHSSIDTNQEYELIAKGLAASSGASHGKIVFSSKNVEIYKKNGEKVILVRNETSPEDIEGMYKADGFLTINGGITSHAAVVGRGIGKPCVVGCNDLYIEKNGSILMLKSKKFTLYEGDYITIDGTTGNIYNGKLKLKDSNIDDNLLLVLSWCDKFRKLKVLTNAETENDVIKSLKFGADGIGLCRTEHMFFDEDRIKIMQLMIISKNKSERVKHLKNLFNYQKNDFEKIFSLMNGKTVTIRYLDPPLHEFLPKNNSNILKEKSNDNSTNSLILKKIEELHESNPMLGHRGCRIGITYPEIYNMQTKAIFCALCNLYKEHNISINLNLMIPFIGDVKELKLIKNDILKNSKIILRKYGYENKIKFKIGAMIELPRSALIANEIAKESDFFSFGTNDLTQTTFGFSRDDIQKFLYKYMNKKIYHSDPFIALDKKGVGELIKIGINKGKESNPNIEISVCGEHAGNPESIVFLESLGINSISCSPYRIPISRLVSAQIEIQKQ